MSLLTHCIVCLHCRYPVGCRTLRVVAGIRILGIDPGSHHLGIGLIDKEGASLRLVHADTLHARRGADLFTRLSSLQTDLAKAVAQFRPHTVAIEDIFYAKSVRSAIDLGTARGLAIAECLRLGLPIQAYAPTSVKSVVAGSGRADKEQVRKMVQLLLGTRLDSLGLDASDALAIAICHASSHLQKPLQEAVLR